MCLYIQNREPLIAKEEVRCFKTLLKCNGGQYISPYCHMDYTDAVKQHGYVKGDSDSKPHEAYIGGRDRLCIDKGYIHTYADNMAGVVSICEKLAMGNRYHVFECIIPKGTRYYVNEEGGCIASEVIQLLDDVTERFRKTVSEIDFHEEMMYGNEDWRYFTHHVNVRYQVWEMYREVVKRMEDNEKPKETDDELYNKDEIRHAIDVLFTNELVDGMRSNGNRIDDAYVKGFRKRLFELLDEVKERRNYEDGNSR